ncbi:hypothetical protein [Deinococcus sp.]|uniref:hypothetical protein n=1 Tax=Deinococcus sp. TaxID=47478 RepID=UPI003C7E1F66
MSLRRAGPLALALSLSSALAGGGTPTPGPWQGTARPIVPPTRCAAVLPRPTRDAQGGYLYGRVWASEPLRIASCWKGTLRGKPFALTGYDNLAAESAVVINYGGKVVLTELGLGSPRVVAFAGTTACFIPSPAKGLLYAVDVPNGRVYADELLANRVCRPERFLNGTGHQKVGGLNTAYPIDYGVIRTY